MRRAQTPAAASSTLTGEAIRSSSGQLGAMDTAALPNGEYTLRLTVVDQTGNYLPPCDVSIIIQN